MDGVILLDGGDFLSLLAELGAPGILTDFQREIA
jgi:hypothetical protein